jgi:hypothetical protein
MIFIIKQMDKATIHDQYQKVHFEISF